MEEALNFIHFSFVYYLKPLPGRLYYLSSVLKVIFSTDVVQLFSQGIFIENKSLFVVSSLRNEKQNSAYLDL